MRLYNTLTRQKEEIKPIEPGHFKIYSCGPTVYRYIHIGNLRTFTMSDWLRRVLLSEGYQVTHIKNITDVGHMRVEMLDQGEDKLIAQARKEGKTSADIAAFYTEAFREDEKKLNILPAHVFPRATEHIPEMLQIVENLLQKGVAYEVDGDIFFDIKAFPEYGKLSGNLLEGLMAGARDTSDSRRRNPEDFPLWKKAEPGREMAWDSPWGRGFPGWHIECSAMSIKYLGEHFDIHTGGVDNIFPHHEDELAQSEAFTGEPFVNYWVHAQHLLADGLKMAKSTGNAYTLAEVEGLGFEPLSLRYFYTTAHYRSRINFTFTALRAAQTALEKLRNVIARLAEEVESGQLVSRHNPAAVRWNEAFKAAILDDLNMPRAMAIVWQMLRTPSDDLNPSAKLAILVDWDKVLGFGLEEYLSSAAWRKQQEIAYDLSRLEPTVSTLVKERSQFRKKTNYAVADRVREQLEEQGYKVRDTANGTMVLPRRPEEDFNIVSASTAAPNYLEAPDRYQFSINLLAQNSRADLERCINSILRHSYGHSLELVIIDNGSTDDTTAYLRNLVKSNFKDNHECDLALQVIFADHNLGFAAGRNATVRASQGEYIVMLDTSIELNGDIWTELEKTLNEPTIGITGSYGLITHDLRDFEEATGEVDAIEGYLLAFRRKQWAEVGPVDEKFRFYRLMDIYLSFFFKAAGYRAVSCMTLAEQLIKHPHREWYSLSEEEQRTKSKKNYDLFRARWHHGQSLLVENYKPADYWYGHDHPNHLDGQHFHAPEEMPLPQEAHSHSHRHQPDHEHSHPHNHTAEGVIWQNQEQDY